MADLAQMAIPDAKAGPWPKITLLTPVRNSARYLEQTIRSVVAQAYPNLEYIILDGGSTDGSIEIIKKYAEHLSWWVSEPDRGMYDALNKGFRRSSGELMGWISATDMLHMGSLYVVGSVFRNFPEVEWITGLPTGFTREGMAVGVGGIPRWSRARFLAGANEHIQQESTFWRRSLWERSGEWDPAIRNGGDFELWVRFFRSARLYPVRALIGGYREHPDALGVVDHATVRRLRESVVETELQRMEKGTAVRLFRSADRIMLRIPKVRNFWSRGTRWMLYHAPFGDWAPVIEFDADKRQWVMRD